MSKLRLRGSTSGFTEIQASAVAGDNTITLPATTGGSLIAADSSGNVNIDSGTLYVDATNNRVGIGSNSPSGQLDVAGSLGTFRVGTSGAEVFFTRNENNDFRANGGSSAAISFGGQSHVRFQTGSGFDERARIDSSGRLLVGTSSARSNFYNTIASAVLQVEGSGGFGDTRRISVISSDNSAEAGGALLLGLQRSGTVGGNTIVQSGDNIGSVTFQGNDGSEFIEAASIAARVDGTPGANDMPGRLVFSTTADGASSPTERMRITNDGKVGIGTTSPTANKLHVAGTTDAIRVSSSGTNVYGWWTDGTIDVIGPGVVSGSNGFLGTATNHDFAFRTNNTTRMTIAAGGSVSVAGALSKGSGSFRIDHPLPEKTDTHQLVHSFIEGPQADLIYRGHVSLQNGSATINIDQAARMTEGTFEALCRNVCCFTTNESDWTPVRGAVSGNILTIEAQDPTSTAEICWMVIGERKDKHMLETDWTDEDGRVITEPLKEPAPAEAL